MKTPTVYKHIPGTIYSTDDGLAQLADKGNYAEVGLRSCGTSYQQKFYSYDNKDLVDLYYILETYLRDKNLI